MRIPVLLTACVVLRHVENSVAQVTPQLCPALPGDMFELAGPFTSLALTGGGGTENDNPYYFGIDKGFQLVDLNGDSLPDILWGFEDQTGAAPHPVWNCIYMNSGCAWVLQSNFTGRDVSCAAALDVDVRGVSFSFKGLTVKQFVSEVAEYFALPRGDVQVRSGAKLLGPTHLMEDIAATRAGFRVALGKHEVSEYTRKRA